MTHAYRDDLDAMLRRADDLERENDRLRARNSELERRFAPPPPVDEAERNRQRLAEALKREREDIVARERARREEEEVLALAKRDGGTAITRDMGRSTVLTMALVALITAGAVGSGAGVALVVVVTGALLAFIGPYDRK